MLKRKPGLRERLCSDATAYATYTYVECVSDNLHSALSETHRTLRQKTLKFTERINDACKQQLMSVFQGDGRQRYTRV